ncbi:hypothetical protein ACS0TY_003531 [Phlomoides rotata]
MIKSSKDTRYVVDSVVTHDGTKFPCWPLPDLLSFKHKIGADAYHKAKECLKRERDRVAHCLHSSSESKLLEKVQNELLSVYATQLLEKEHSGCHALLRDDKVDDLSRMYRLFSKFSRGLDPVANIFKQVCYASAIETEFQFESK